MKGIFIIFTLLVSSHVISKPITTQKKTFKDRHIQVDDNLIGVKVCIIGDAGEGRPAQYAVSRAMENEGCEQIRYTGDIIYPRGIKHPNDPLLEEKFYRPYRNLLDKNIPFYLTMGNHDWKGNTKAWITIAKDDPNIIFPHRYYTEKWNDGVCVINMDTDYYEKLKHIFRGRNFRHTSWVKKVRKHLKKQDCRFSLAFSHHPHLSVGSHGNSQLLLAQFFRKHIVGVFDVHFAGHDHNLSYEGQQKGTHFLVSGAAGKLRPLARKPKPGNYAVSKIGYITLELSGGVGSLPVVANYRFRTLEPDENGNWPENATTTFTGFMAGNGVR